MLLLFAVKLCALLVPWILFAGPLIVFEWLTSLCYSATLVIGMHKNGTCLCPRERYQHIVEESVWRWMCGRVCRREMMPLRKADSVSLSSEVKPHLFCFLPALPLVKRCFGILFVRALDKVCRTLNGEITARRQTQLALQWLFFPKRLKAANKQVGQLWVSVNVLTPPRGVNQRRAGAPLGASSRGLRLCQASNLNSCCLIYMTQILLLLSLMLRGLQTFPDCFETRCSRFVNILTFLGAI